MPDKSTTLVVEGLTRALGAPRGLPLVGSRTRPGLFAAAAKKLAQLCKEQGLVDVVGVEKQGRAALEICTVNDKGLAYLLAQSSPRAILEKLLGSLEGQQESVATLAHAAEKIRDELDSLKALVERVLHPPAANGNGHSPVFAKDCGQLIREALAEWTGAGDCPLPELYRRLEPTFPHWTIGRFHDHLRLLREDGLIYLHPWTGPLYDLPEPPFALMIGHEVAYYASQRMPNAECRMSNAG